MLLTGSVLPSSLSVVVLWTAAVMGASIEQDDRPNVLLLLTDDQDLLLGGIDRMPNLKEFITDQGTFFENGFVHSPICCPSRSSILTGRYLQNGVAMNNSRAGNCWGADWRENAEHRSFAFHAQQAGYETAYLGKYMNSYGRGKGNQVAPPYWSKWFGLVGNAAYYNYSVVESNDGGNTSKVITFDDVCEMHNCSYL
jgi:arylsulfatase A-like enzyme